MGGVRAKHDLGRAQGNDQGNTMAVAFALAIALTQGNRGGAGGCCPHQMQQQQNPAQQLFGMGFVAGAMASQGNNPMNGFHQPFGMQQNPLFGNQFGNNFGANFGAQQNPAFAAGLGMGVGLAMGSQQNQHGFNPGNTLLGPQFGQNSFGPQCAHQPFGQSPFGGPPQNPLSQVVGLIMRILSGGQAGGPQGAHGHHGHNHNHQFQAQNGSFAFAAAGAF